MLSYGEEKTRKLGNVSAIASAAGFFGAMTWAIVKRKKFWSVVGISVLGGILANIVALGISIVVIKDTPKKA